MVIIFVCESVLFSQKYDIGHMVTAKDNQNDELGIERVQACTR